MDKYFALYWEDITCIVFLQDTESRRVTSNTEFGFAPYVADILTRWLSENMELLKRVSMT